MTLVRKPVGGSLGLTVSVVLALGASGIVSAADAPTFRPGMWHFERSMNAKGGKPEKVETTECLDPTLNQKRQVEKLTKTGCKFEPVVHSGSTWRRKATCKIGDITSTSDSVITVEGPDAYSMTVENVINGQKSHEELKARRVGDCPKQ
jgi:hypothetical protein